MQGMGDSGVKDEKDVESNAILTNVKVTYGESYGVPHSYYHFSHLISSFTS